MAGSPHISASFLIRLGVKRAPTTASISPFAAFTNASRLLLLILHPSTGFRDAINYGVSPPSLGSNPSSDFTPNTSLIKAMSSPKIILYTNRGCPWAHRAHIALKESGLEYEEVTIDLDTPREPWYLEVNHVCYIV